MIRSKINQMLDELPEEHLLHTYWTLEFIHKKYKHRKILIDKGIVITELYGEADDIFRKWDQTFARKLSDEVKDAIHYDQYKWHMFSYEEKKCLKEDKARRAFDAVPKDEMYGMYQDLTSVFLYENAAQAAAADFESEQDIYLFDRNFTWTYVHTHESMCGPYFYKLK